MMREFREKVATPALSQLQPIPRELVGGSRGFMVQIARDNSHNSLCYEMRLSFALAIGAASERHLRLWLPLNRADLRPMIERGDCRTLFKHAAEAKGSISELMINVADITEL